jgi:hypothetical protein
MRGVRATARRWIASCKGRSPGPRSMPCIASRWTSCCASARSMSAGPSEEKEQFNRVWHRLASLARCHPWAHPPTQTLRARHAVEWEHRAARWTWPGRAPCRGTPVLSAELAHAYKPDPRVYQLAITLLSLERHEVMLVAARKAGSARRSGAGDTGGLCSTPTGAWSAARSGSHT